jgi:uncharacterized membrane protein YhaH (DUF805 family)
LNSEQNEMHWRSFLLSFTGRVNRQKWWLFFVVPSALVLAATVGLLLLAYSHLPITDNEMIALFLVPYAIIMYVGAAVGAKRLHDRNKSGWWQLLLVALPIALNVADQLPGLAEFKFVYVFGLVSLAISIWWLIELGCLRGTSGPNRYGPDPLAAEPNPSSARP